MKTYFLISQKDYIGERALADCVRHACHSIQSIETDL